MSRFFSLIFLLFLTFSLPLAAQEIWMEPSRFHFEVGESAAFTFRKGEDFVGKTLSTDNGLVSRMEHHTPSKKSTLLDLAAEAGKSAIHMSLAEGGTHVILAETALEEIVWEGNKFSERLKNGALDDVTYARRKAGILSERATELSSHHIKTLLHAGTETDDAFAKVFGLPIEIIPNKNPAGLKKATRSHSRSSSTESPCLLRKSAY